MGTLVIELRQARAQNGDGSIRQVNWFTLFAVVRIAVILLGIWLR